MHSSKMTTTKFHRVNYHALTSINSCYLLMPPLMNYCSLFLLKAIILSLHKRVRPSTLEQHPTHTHSHLGAPLKQLRLRYIAQGHLISRFVGGKEHDTFTSHTHISSTDWTQQSSKPNLEAVIALASNAAVVVYFPLFSVAWEQRD